MKKSILPVFIPHSGCPNACVFCDQHHISGHRNIALDALCSEIQDRIEALETSPVLAFYGGTFTGLPFADMKRLLDLALHYHRSGKIAGIRFSTHPETLSMERLVCLKDYPIELIELGIQSFSDAVLTASNRGTTRAQMLETIDRLRKAELPFGLQLMMGLPEDNKTRFLTTVKEAIALKPQALRLYPTLILQGTALETLWREGRYQALTLETAIDWAYEALRLIQPSGIPLIRLGLHMTEDLLGSQAVVSGPVHPAFGQLVYEKAVYEAIQKAFLDQPFAQIEVIEGHPSLISCIAGQKGDNRIRLIALLGSDFKIRQNAELRHDQLRLHSGQLSRVIGLWT